MGLLVKGGVFPETHPPLNPSLRAGRGG
ncbi:MAG: hypothetical protein QOH86_1112, partial [Sphingomonadales bacterium]|nr:hypothetical protein [Sphingomonadales bacterium]